MSFFHEPPPLDSDIPPPLDDKLKDNDFDLDEEEIIIEDEELPELPTDYNVFSSVSTDENLSYSHPPPFSNFDVDSSPPPDDQKIVENNCDKSESPESSDVAKEKESCEIDLVVDRVASDDNKLDAITRHSLDNDAIVNDQTPPPVSCDEVDDEKSFTSVSSEDKIDIPCIKDFTLESDLQSNYNENQDEVISIEGLKVEDEDDFNEFVEASLSDAHVESSDALKSEEILGNNSDFDVFTKFSSPDIPETIPELNLDNDDDDFNDFETAIPVNRQVEQVQSFETTKVESQEPVEFQFEADFSAFNAFSEPAAEGSTFDEFQDFKAAGFDNSVKELENQLQDDDDDDFGDFNDFTQAPEPTAQPAQLELQPVAFLKPENVNGIVDMMFPPTSSSTDEKPEALDSDYASEQQVIKSDNFVNKFNDFDSTLALGYLYNNSKASQTLVKALGIDTRNILLGPQWMSSSSSSSSNMPRFAANMSFNPIEPIKPSTSIQSSTFKSSTETKSTILQPTKVLTEIVPEAEFDWNSSGLVNPLDGPQPKPKQPHDVEPVVVQQQQQPATAEPPTHSFENESSLYVMDQEVTQVFEAEAKANASNKPELTDSSAYQWTNDVGSQHHVGHFSSSVANSNILVRERTIKLPETHIFTPVKGTSPVAREVVSRDVSPAPDDPYFPKGPITVKEYHDVEYSLEPKKRLDSDADFDDFQSAQPSVVKSDPPLVPLNLLEPLKVEKLSTEIKWPEPGNVAQTTSNELDFLETLAPIASKPIFNLPLPPPASTAVNLKKKEPAFSKPVIGTSPTEHNGKVEDDDFTDFQAAPPPTRNQQPPAKMLQSNDPITLSPARLVANVGRQPNQKSSWISSLDNEEMSRFEAAFPKCKTDKKISNDDEDDWSDFVGAAQNTSHPFPQSQPPSMISSNSMENSGKYSNGDVDDWSDFVSVPPPVGRIPSAKSSGAISSQFQSKPNFSSWHQPMSRPYVNHATSFLSHESGNQSQQFTSGNYPYVTDKMPRHGVNITNNFNYAFNHPEQQGAPGSHHHHQQKPNGISTILPELDFAMPKNLINLPRGGGQIDPGKK